MSPRDDFELGAGRAARSTAAVAAAIRGRPVDLVHDLLGVAATWRAWRRRGGRGGGVAGVVSGAIGAGGGRAHVGEGLWGGGWLGYRFGGRRSGWGRRRTSGQG